MQATNGGDDVNWHDLVSRLCGCVRTEKDKTWNHGQITSEVAGLATLKPRKSFPIHTKSVAKVMGTCIHPVLPDCAPNTSAKHAGLSRTPRKFALTDQLIWNTTNSNKIVSRRSIIADTMTNHDQISLPRLRYTVSECSGCDSDWDQLAAVSSIIPPCFNYIDVSKAS